MSVLSVTPMLSPTEARIQPQLSARQHCILTRSVCHYMYPRTILHTSYTPAPSHHNPSRTFARNTHSPRPPAPTTASPSIGSATTALTMSSALTSPKMTGLPVHVRYVTPLGRVASSARSPKRPMMDARKKEYSVTPGLEIRGSWQRGKGACGGRGESGGGTYR